jgi:hypothetical protein
LLQSLFGKVFADRGYVSKPLAHKLLQEFGIEFFAKPKRNMKNQLMSLTDKLLARKPSIIETIIDQLKISPKLSILVIVVLLILRLTSCLA